MADEEVDYASPGPMDVEASSSDNEGIAGERQKIREREDEEKRGETKRRQNN